MCTCARTCIHVRAHAHARTPSTIFSWALSSLPPDFYSFLASLSWSLPAFRIGLVRFRALKSETEQRGPHFQQALSAEDVLELRMWRLYTSVFIQKPSSSVRLGLALEAKNNLARQWHKYNLEKTRGVLFHLSWTITFLFSQRRTLEPGMNADPGTELVGASIQSGMSRKPRVPLTPES